MISEKLKKVLLGFTFPHECAFRKGHWGDYAFVVSENVSGDAGGLTKWGIDQGSHPHIDIEKLTKESAEEIYAESYWKKIRAEEILEPLCFVIFDVAINNGVYRAALWLQEYAKVTMDGFIGPITLAACNKIPIALSHKIIDRRESFYHQLSKKPGQQQFLEGWLNRNHDLSSWIATLQNDAT